MGGSHTYAVSGLYGATATVTGSDGISFTVSVPVEVAPAVVPVLLFGLGAPTIWLSIAVNGCGSVTNLVPTGPSLLPATLLQVGQTLFPYALRCAGWSFTGWTGGGPGCAGKRGDPCIIVVPPVDVGLTANFKKNP